MSTDIAATPAESAPAPASTPAPAGGADPIDAELGAIWDKNQEPAAPPAPAEKPDGNKAAAAALGGEAPPEEDNSAAAAPAEGEGEADEATDSDQPATKEGEPAQSPAIAAPNSWSAEYQGKWKDLSPDVQTYVAEREKAAHAKITQQGQELKSFVPVREVYGYLNARGVPEGQEAQVVQSWARAQHALDTDPVQALRWLARDYGVDLAQLASDPKAKPNGDAQAPPDGEASDGSDIFRDPRLDRIAPEIDDLKKTIGQMANFIRSREHASVQERTEQAEELIEKFSQDKADWGDVQEDVIREIAIVRQANPKLPMDQILNQAYERARWANPDVRSRILDEEKRAAAEALEARRKAEAAEAAKKQAQAKKMATMNQRTTAASPAAAPGKSMLDDSELEALYDRIQSGA